MATWHLDPETLREVVDDPEALERELATATPLDQVWMLRILGRLPDAERLGREQLSRATDRWRPLLLLADVLRWQYDFAEAERLQNEAVAIAGTDSRRATAFQHIGKRLVDQGLWEDAAQQFAQALELRVAIGAASDLIDSSRSALDRARR